MNADETYLDLLEDVLTNGTPSGDRTGTGTLKVFGRQMRFDLSREFPLLTTKRVSFWAIARELQWFLRGRTNIRPMVADGLNIWVPDAHRYYKDNGGTLSRGAFRERLLSDDDFARQWGEMGPIYPRQWRRYGGQIDQVGELIQEIKANPESRRLLVQAWDPASHLPSQQRAVLPPCHTGFQVQITGETLNLRFEMRSSDVFLGCPYNIASYALLAHMLAQLTGYEPGTLIYQAGDVHLYRNHVDQAREQLSRTPTPLRPQLLMPSEPPVSIENYSIDNMEIVHYAPHDRIPASLSV